jgi:PAS domain S-box-containing protein
LDKQAFSSLKLFMDATPVGIVAIGDDARIIYANPLASKLFGKQVTDEYGITCGAFIDCPNCHNKPEVCGQSESCPNCSLFRAISAVVSGKPNEEIQEGETFLERDAGFSSMWIKYKFNSIGMEGRKVLIMAVEDITKQKKAEEASYRQKANLELLMDTIPSPIFYKDTDGKYTGCNRAFEEFIGRSREQIIGRSVYDMAPKSISDKYKEKDDELFKKPGRQRYEWKVKVKEGFRDVIFDKATILNSRNHPEGLIGVITDITERKKAESLRKDSLEKLRKYKVHLEELVQERTEALRQSKRFLEAVFDSIQDGIIVLDTKLNIVFANKKMEKWYSHMLPVVGKKCYEAYHQKSSPCKDCPTARALKTGKLEMVEHPLKQEDINVGALELYAFPMFDDTGKPKGVVQYIRNITERKQNEKVIKDSLREKEILLKEVHHRVKNNMQVISSLLNLQIMKSKDGQVKKALMDCQGRISSMASAHEMLYMSNSLCFIDCEKYISKLSRNIMHSYQTDLRRIKLKVTAKDVTLGIQQASTLGLIINELLSNALKYGFPENMHGQIMIRLKTIEQDIIEFVFQDNGVGILEIIDWRNTESLGLNLIVQLAEKQLGGTINLDRKEGICFTIRFKREIINQ